MWNNPHRLEIAEYIALVGCIVGSLVALIFNQPVFAYVPLTISVSLSLINRYRLDQLSRRRTTAAITRSQQQLSEEITQLQASIKALPESTHSNLEPVTESEKTSDPVSQKDLPSLAPIYQNIAQLQEESASVQESISSVIHYLNSSSILERVDRAERTLTQLSERLTGLITQIDAVGQRRWAEKFQQPGGMQSVDFAPPPPPPQAPQEKPPAALAVTSPPAKSIVLPKFVSEATAQNWSSTRTIKAHSDWTSALAISPDGQRLVSGSFDKTLKIWHLQTGELLHTLNEHVRGVFSVAISPNSQIIASGSWDETIKLWKLDDGSLLDTLTAHSGSVRSIAISPDSKILASGSFDETIKLWDLATGVLQTSLTAPPGPIYAIAIAPDGQLLASGGGNGIIHLWHLCAGNSPKGDNLASRRRQLTGNLDFVWSLCFSPDGQILASGNGDGTVKLWQTRTGEFIGTLAEHSGPVYAVTFSTDGQTVISGSADGTVKIWAIATGKRLCNLGENNKPVISIAKSPSGQLFASGSADGSISIWQRD